MNLQAKVFGTVLFITQLFMHYDEYIHNQHPGQNGESLSR